jgi:hypothetical protein
MTIYRTGSADAGEDLNALKSNVSYPRSGRSDQPVMGAAAGVAEGGHPAVAGAGPRLPDNVLFDERVNYAASYAFQRLSDEDAC